MGLCSVPCRADLFWRATLDKGGAKSRLSITRPPVLLFHAFASTNFCVVTLVWGRGYAPSEDGLFLEDGTVLRAV
jgi:hypothetical protein